VVGTDVPDADVIAHDDDDIGPLLLLLCGCWRTHRHYGG
jgi:hypothetical protein